MYKKKKYSLHLKKAHEVKSAADAHLALQKLWEHNALSTRHSRVTIQQQDGQVRFKSPRS